MNHTIRTACAHDAAAIVALLSPIIAAGRFTVMDQPVTVADQLEYIGSFPARGVYHVAVAGPTDRVVGIQSIERAESAPAPLRHVGDISTFVALDAHRVGIGRSLMAATLDAARARGFRKVMATIRADNPGAIAYYRTEGFTVIGTARRHACIGGVDVDEVMTERWIGDD